MKEHIQAAEVFAGISTASVGLLAASGTWTLLDTGETLYSVGDEADAIYLVVEGILTVSPQDGAYVLVSGLLGVLVRKPDGTDRLVNYIRSGEIVGEMAVLSDEARAATVYATRESDLLFFGKREFLILIEKYHGFLLGIARLNIDRLRHSISQARPGNNTSVTALVAASAGVPMVEFARRLAAA